MADGTDMDIIFIVAFLSAQVSSRLPHGVVPAKAGTHIPENGACGTMGPRLRGDDNTASHSPNTNSTVAFDSVFISGERASLARPTTPMPEAMAMYCLPSTM